MSAESEAGLVYLVGAGPGDPGLLTGRARELIAAADAILYDRLIPPGALADARPGAELVYVGKEPGAPAMPQERINQRLVELGRSGRTVVRLKGGDPFVFGRGGEEAEALAAAGVRFEIVPGVTAGLAGPAYAGIPATHRDLASAVALVSAHEDPAKESEALDWSALARFPGTLVLYMGVGRLEQVASRLVAEGRDRAEPAAIVERASLPGQRTIAAPLAQLAERAAEARVSAPAVVVVGAVARLHETLDWLGARPLAGLRVVVTRARARASALAARLRRLGADVVEAPSIRIEPRPVAGELADAIDRVREHGLVCLTSPSGAELLLAALRARGGDARALAGAKVGAIGPGTAAALAAGGIVADVVAEQSTAEGLVEALADTPVAGTSVLVARGAEARDVLVDALTERGAEVEVAVLYDTRAEPVAAELLDGAPIDYVTFTSSSTVRNFLDGLERAGRDFPRSARVVSIGPVTSAAARERGLEVAAEAERHDIDGLVDALLADAGARR